MSDPITNAEVENVLASIRRLVSDQKAVEPAPPPDVTPERLVLTPALRVGEADGGETNIDDEVTVPPGHVDANGSVPDGLADIAAAAAADGFVHMDGQPGVSYDEDHWQEAAPQIPSPATAAQKPDAARSAAEPRRDPSDDDPFATALSWPVVARKPATDHGAPSEPEGQHDDTAGTERAEEAGADWQDVQGADPQDARAADQDAGTPQADEPGALGGDRAEPDLSGVPAAPESDDENNTHFSGIEDASLREKVAALETLIAGRTDQWEPDDVGADPYAGTQAPSLAWEDPLEEPVQPKPEADVLPEDTAPAAPIPETPSAEDGLSEFVSEDDSSDPEPAAYVLDNAGGFQDTTQVEDGEARFEPSEASHVPPDTNPDDTTHVAPADPEEEFAPLGTPTEQHYDEAGEPFDDVTSVFATDADVLDEAALRDLVSEIVRQELQGALGERITRNVRKLVRREIHRALAANELE